MERNMKEPRNKSKRLKEKKYLERFNRLCVYSYIRNNKICLGVKPEEVSELFSNACGKEREKGEKPGYLRFIDQSAMQYYMILGLQDFYQNHFLPLRDENITLRKNWKKHRQC